MLHLSFLSYFIILALFLIAISGQWVAEIDADLWRYPMALFLMLILFEWRINRQHSPQLNIQAPDHPRLGHSFYAELILHNPHSVRLTLQSKQSLPDTLSGESKILHWDLAANQTQTQRLKFNAQSLGTVNWGSAYLRVKGLFGLVWWEKKLQIEQQLEIVPDFLDHKERVHGTNTSNERPSRITGNGYELLSIRDYHYGDPMRSIDWKASAKHDKHKVRVMTQEQNLDMLILLDIGRYSSYQAGNLSRLHHVVNISTRLSEKAILNGDSVGLITFADKVYSKIKPSNTIKSLSRVRTELNNLESVMHEPNILLACYEGLKLLSQRSLIIIFTDLERKDVDGQLIKSVNLLSRKHFTVVASIINEELIHTINQPAKEWLDPYKGLAARETLKFIQNNRIHLQRYGVQTVATTPSQLDGQVFKSYEMVRARQQV